MWRRGRTGPAASVTKPWKSSRRRYCLSRTPRLTVFPAKNIFCNYAECLETRNVAATRGLWMTKRKRRLTAPSHIHSAGSAAEFRSCLPMSSVLSIVDLRKLYADSAAVDGISFEVRRNEIVGLLGPNGAGKTTTINMVLGVLEPSAGRILIEDIDIAEHRTQALERTNFAAVYAPLPGNLTVYQNLRVFGLMYAVKQLGARIEALLEEFDLQKFRNVKCGVLSSGEQTRVSLAKAMINNPQLL